MAATADTVAKIIAMVAMTSLLLACGNSIGTPCSIQGSGFTASHDCSEKCLFYNAIHCPDGQTVVPKICSGAAQCKPGSCPDGQACYSYDDPFEEKSYCIPSNLCGVLSVEELSDWELSAQHRAGTRRAEWKRKMPSQGEAVTETAPAKTPAKSDSLEQK